MSPIAATRENHNNIGEALLHRISLGQLDKRPTIKEKRFLWTSQMTFPETVMLPFPIDTKDFLCLSATPECTLKMTLCFVATQIGLQPTSITNH